MKNFFYNFHNRLQSFSVSDALTFCEKTIETVSLEIKETQKQLNNKLENEEREEITLKQRKHKQLNYLKFSKIKPITEF